MWAHQKSRNVGMDAANLGPGSVLLRLFHVIKSAELFSELSSFPFGEKRERERERGQRRVSEANSRATKKEERKRERRREKGGRERKKGNGKEARERRRRREERASRWRQVDEKVVEQEVEADGGEARK